VCYLTLVMKAKEKEPLTLQEAIKYFGNPDNCLNYIAARRWRDGIVRCPSCGSDQVSFIPTRRLWECKAKHEKRQFSVKVGTVMEDSPIGLDKWLCAFWMIANCKNGVSSYEIHRAVGVTQKSAWFMLHRIRLAMQDGPYIHKLGGPGTEVEVDESFVGGKMSNMHSRKRNRIVHKAGTSGAVETKTIVMGFLDRDLRKIRTEIVPTTSRVVLQNQVFKHVAHGTNLYTDQSSAYQSLNEHPFVHRVVNHLETYVKGRVHTNGLENFWSLLKRHLAGTYVAVEPFHLFRYLDEQVFRYNNRATRDNPLNDSDRFDLAVSQIVNKRLTYAELTGKVGETIN